MNKPTILKTERVDDIPLLLAQLERMGVQELLEQHFPTHGNWQGLSLGQVAIVWLSHILSQADHRMNQVQSWAEKRIESLGIILGQEVRALDLSDDRKTSVVFNLSKDESWINFEKDLSQRQLQVYDLKTERVRLDSTSVSGFHQENKEGLFRYGHSKDHRPDLPQLKLMMATDLKKYISDIKEKEIELEDISYDYANGKTVIIAKGYEQLYSCSLKEGKSEKIWSERRLIVYSIAHAQSQKQALQSRIDKTKQSLELLNQTRRGKKPFKDFQEFIQSAEQIITNNRVQSLFNLSFTEDVTQTHQRKYLGRPAGVIEKRTYQVEYNIDLDQVEQQMELLGWQVYATNHPKKELALADAVVAYRQEYLIEHCFGRLKGQPLSLRPMFLQREDHIKGLMRLLSIGLKLLTLVEFQVKRALEVDKSKLDGIYAGNPRRATAQPTTERLLASFKEITIVLIAVGAKIYTELTTLNPLQQKILQLLNFPSDIYTRLSSQSDDPP